MFGARTIPVVGSIILCILLEGCGPDVETLVSFDRAKIPTLGKVGIVCVYEAVGSIFGSSLPTEERKELFRQASPAEELRWKFIQWTAHWTGPVVEISENDPEVLRIKGTRGLDRIDDYQVEKLNYGAIGDKHGVQTLIIIRTWDFTSFEGALPHIDLCADARMIDVRTGTILWRKKVGGFACRRVLSPGSYNAADIKREFAAPVDCVVKHLSLDFPP